MGFASLLATSDLHVGYNENRHIVDKLTPSSPDDWLIVAGDVADTFSDVEATLALLSQRFAQVIWAPGNHELWTPRTDPVQLRGEARYRELVAMCRRLGVLTPEDEYPIFTGAGGPVRIAPLFVLYDYSFLAPGARTKEESLRAAYDSGIVCADETLLHPDPYPSREAWCGARIAHTEARLAALDPTVPTVLVNHYPLVREPTFVLRYPQFAQWCGSTRTADWHLRFGACVMVYGHLHIPRTTVHDGVRFEEVSLGYPREWSRRASPPEALRSVLVPDGHVGFRFAIPATT